jgi:hypothetical protein
MEGKLDHFSASRQADSLTEPPMNSNFRLALGGALLAAGAVLPLSAVFVFETDWPPILKSALTGILLLGPELAAIPAAAIMGRENFARIVAGLKRCIPQYQTCRKYRTCPTRHRHCIVSVAGPAGIRHGLSTQLDA